MRRKTVGYLTDLPPELQSDILLRLPVKSLLFCKCVCKSLRSLISNPNFVQSHLTRINSPQKSLILHCNNEKYLLLYTTTKNPNVSSLSLTPLLPHLPDPHVVTIVGSCNGLILIAVWLGDLIEPDYLLMLWNPVIGQHRYLPKPNHKCRSFHEFGFIPETNDYVILKIGESESLMELYKLSNDSWITVDCDLSWRGFDIISQVGSFVNPMFLYGSFHWVTSNINDIDIVYYNIKDEKLGVIKAVDCNRLKWFTGYRGYGASVIFVKKLAMIDQSLAMIYYHRDETFPLEIWVMNNYGVEDSWTLQFLIRKNISDYRKPCDLAGYWTSGLMIIDEVELHPCEGDEDFVELVSAFMLYDINTGSMMKIARMDKVYEITGFCSFVETLVPVIKVD